jgi:hypothetical protein
MDQSVTKVVTDLSFRTGAVPVGTISKDEEQTHVVRFVGRSGCLGPSLIPIIGQKSSKKEGRGRSLMAKRVVVSCQC